MEMLYILLFQYVIVAKKKNQVDCQHIFESERNLYVKVQLFTHTSYVSYLRDYKCHSSALPQHRSNPNHFMYLNFILVFGKKGGG